MKKQNKNILIFKSSDSTTSVGRDKLISNLVRSLEHRGFKFHFISFGLKLFPVIFYYRLFKKCKTIFCLELKEKFWATPFARLLLMRMIWLEYDLIDRGLAKSFKRFGYKLLSPLVIIIAVSNVIKEQLLTLGIKSKNVKTIYNSIDLAEYQTQDSIFQTLAKQKQPALYNSQFIIGCISNLNKENGVAYLLQAFKIAGEMLKNIQLIVIGHGAERNNLIWLAKRLEVDKKIVFVGWQENLSRWILGFDIFTLPAIYKKGFGLILLEAMAHAKPIIATKVGSIPEIVKQNKTGILIEPKNPEMMAQAIINLYHHPDWREEMGQNARRRVEEKFNLERMIQEYEKILS